MRYVYGKNMPGFLPDGDTQETVTLDEAFSATLEDMNLERETGPEGNVPQWHYTIDCVEEDHESAAAPPLEYSGPDGYVYFIHVTEIDE